MSPATGLCEGCARTLDEIAAWGQLDDAAKSAVWSLLPARQAQLAQRPVAMASPEGRAE
jgi:hypothetical protein